MIKFCRTIVEYKKKIFSQDGEDGILERIFSVIGTTNKYFVEFGYRGKKDNSLYLEKYFGFAGLCIDKDKTDKVEVENITAENINDIFAKYSVPCAFDLLSIDIDGNDYWVWKAIDEKYLPRVVVIEYNCNFSVNECKVLEYDPRHIYERKTIYYGASLGAMRKLGKTKGYSLVAEVNYCNAIFIKSDLLDNDDMDIPIEEIFPKKPNPTMIYYTRKKMEKLKRRYKWVDV